MNAVIMSFDPNEKQCNLREKAMKRMTAVESDSVKSARKATQLKLGCTCTPPVNVLTHIRGVNDLHRCT